MLNVFDVFKIILGIIISIFIIFVVMRFVGSYMEIGESGRQVSLMVNFKKTVENVYTTGISTDFELKESEILGYRPPMIETEVTFIDTSPTPVLLLPGKKLTVSRVDYDIGWWKFYMIEALPESKIIFVPLNANGDTWSLVGNITKAMPSTENTETKIRFGVGCNGTEFRFGWEAYRFVEKILPMIISGQMEFRACEDLAYFRKNGYTLVTISEKDEDVEFLVKPSEGGVGHVYIKNGDEYQAYVYKNGMDIVSLLLGGQFFYDYTNDKFLRELDVAASITSKEYNLLLNDPEINRRCGNQMNEFVALLGSIRETAAKLRSSDDENTALEFTGYMRDSAVKFREIESMGCA
jgi:hypothetical protein